MEGGIMENTSIEVKTTLSGGGELTIAAMNEYSFAEVGRKTYRFVRRVMQNPEYRELIRARAAQIREEEASAQNSAVVNT